MKTNFTSPLGKLSRKFINTPQGRVTVLKKTQVFHNPSNASKALSRILIVISLLCSAEGKLAEIIFISTWVTSIIISQFTFETSTLSLKRERAMMLGMMRMQKTRTLESPSSRLPKVALSSRNILKACTVSWLRLK